MPFELRLTFGGLTALVPNKPVGNHGAATEWLVVMPALAQGAFLEKGDQKFSIAPHQAALVVKAKALWEEPHLQPPQRKEVRLRFRDPRQEAGDEGSDLLYELDREVLEIASGTPALTVHQNTTAAHLPDGNDPGQIGDIKWVPAIAECAPGTSIPFDRQLFDQNTLSPSNSLAAVVRLDRGHLETREVHRDLQHAPVSYEFRNAAGPIFQQALADGFQLRVRIETDKAQLNLTDHAGNRRRLFLRPYPGCPAGADGPIVEVKVFNRELEEILGFSAERSLAIDPEAGDTDFVIFYKLSPAWDSLNADDLALAYRLGDGGGGRSKPCEPPLYPGLG